MKLFHLLAAAFVLVLPVGLLAQGPVTTSDLSRLDATVADIRQQVTALKATDATLAGELERTLNDLADEVVYLRVKLRRDGSVSREDYGSLRDHLETLRVRAQGQKGPGAPGAGAEPGAGIVPVGAEFDVRLQTPLNSATAKPEQRFEATTVLDYEGRGVLLIPAGSLTRGFVGSVRAAGKIDRRGSLTLAFDEIRIGERSYRLRASVVDALDAKAADDARRIGIGAAAGAILGGILGGGKGALMGVLIGGGGTMAARDGADVDLPLGTVLRIRVDQPLELAAP